MEGKYIQELRCTFAPAKAVRARVICDETAEVYMSQTRQDLIGP